MSDILKQEMRDRLAVFTINRPEVRNALSPELVALLIQGIRAADANPAVKCILIEAAGDNFSAGGDIKGFSQVLDAPAQQRYDEFERRLLVANRLPQAILDASKPVVVVTRGAVAGAGLSLCLAADYVLCGASTFFVVAHVNIGLSLDCGLSGLLIGAMGVKAAKRMALLGERIDAAKALQLGMVTDVLGDDDLPAATLKLTTRLANGPAIAMASSKRLLNQAAFGDFQRQLADEAAAIAACAASDDFATGVKAALAGARPQFD